MLTQNDARAAKVMQAADLLRWRQPELATELRSIARWLIGQIEQPKLTRRVHTDRMVVNGRTVMVVQQRRGSFGV